MIWVQSQVMTNDFSLFELKMVDKLRNLYLKVVGNKLRTCRSKIVPCQRTHIKNKINLRCAAWGENRFKQLRGILSTPIRYGSIHAMRRSFEHFFPSQTFRLVLNSSDDTGYFVVRTTSRKFVVSIVPCYHLRHQRGKNIWMKLGTNPAPISSQATALFSTPCLPGHLMLN